jgi:hypothetical protein
LNDVRLIEQLYPSPPNSLVNSDNNWSSSLIQQQQQKRKISVDTLAANLAQKRMKEHEPSVFNQKREREDNKFNISNLLNKNTNKSTNNQIKLNNQNSNCSATNGRNSKSNGNESLSQEQQKGKKEKHVSQMTTSAIANSSATSNSLLNSLIQNVNLIQQQQHQLGNLTQQFNHQSTFASPLNLLNQQQMAFAALATTLLPQTSSLNSTAPTVTTANSQNAGLAGLTGALLTNPSLIAAVAAVMAASSTNASQLSPP